MFKNDNFEYDTNNCLVKKIKKFYRKINNKKDNSFYANLKEEELHNSNNIFDLVANKIFDLFSNCKSAGDNLFHLIDIKSSRLKEIFIKDFYSNFIIWGIRDYSITDENLQIFTVKYNYNHLTEQISSLETFLSSQEIEHFRSQKIIVNLSNLLNYFKIIRNNLQKLDLNKDINLNNFQNDSKFIDDSSINIEIEKNPCELFEKKLDMIGRGNLVGLNCGHNGALNHSEKISLNYQIQSSGFFDGK